MKLSGRRSKNVIDARSKKNKDTYMTSYTSMQGQKRLASSMESATRVRPLNKKVLGFDGSDMEKSVARSRLQGRGRRRMR